MMVLAFSNPPFFGHLAPNPFAPEMPTTPEMAGKRTYGLEPSFRTGGFMGCLAKGRITRASTGWIPGVWKVHGMGAWPALGF